MHLPTSQPSLRHLSRLRVQWAQTLRWLASRAAAMAVRLKQAVKPLKLQWLPVLLSPP